jgi:hypothetical protein
MKWPAVMRANLDGPWVNQRVSVAPPLVQAFGHLLQHDSIALAVAAGRRCADEKSYL